MTYLVDKVLDNYEISITLTFKNVNYYLNFLILLRLYFIVAYYGSD